MGPEHDLSIGVVPHGIVILEKGVSDNPGFISVCVDAKHTVLIAGYVIDIGRRRDLKVIAAQVYEETCVTLGR